MQMAQLQHRLVELRRELHQIPEIGLQVPRTQERVLAELDGLDLEISTGKDLTSVTAVLRGEGPSPVGSKGARPAVLLRADMDALPVEELTGLEFASTNGNMHACGHDLHTTMLIGAAHLLHERRDELAGDVVLMFQPGEEGMGGAKVMIEEGVLDAAGPRVQAAFGMHVFAAMDPGGSMITKPGPMLAAADEARITIHGKGGHGSAPHGALDPVPVAAELVTALNTQVTRRFSVYDPVVVTVGVLRAGTTASNVIPDDAYLAATIRSFSPEHRAKLQQVITDLANGIASAHDLTATVDYDLSFPVTVNDEAETAFATGVIEQQFPGRHLRWANPLSGSEDFSFVLEQVPGSFVGLSCVPPGNDPLTAEYNHSPRAVFDDRWLADGAQLYADLAMHRLSADR